MEVQRRTFFILGARWVNAMPWPMYPKDRASVPIAQEAGWVLKTNYCLRRGSSRAPCSPQSLYADYVIQAPLFKGSVAYFVGSKAAAA